MKKIGLYLTSLCLSIVFLTSCMKGSNVWEGLVLGVVGYNKTFTPVIHTSSFGDLYSPSLNSGELFDGDCGIFYVRIDSDLPENSSAAIASYGFQTITILNQLKLSKYELQYVFTDTSKVLANEVPIVKPYSDFFDYIDGIFFMGHVVNIPNDYVLTWELSYDSNTMMPTIENGTRYYDLYLRAMVTKEGTQTSKTDIEFTNAYFLKYYFRNAAIIEKNILGTSYSETGSKFTVRINYPSSIDTSTNTIKWSSSQLDNIFYVASFLD